MKMCIKVKCNIIFSVVLFLFLQLSFSQTITVLEKGSNEPIPGVALYNLKKTKWAVTDINGKAPIENFNDREIIYFQNLLYEKRQLRKFEIKENNYRIYLTTKVEGLVGSNIVSSFVSLGPNSTIHLSLLLRVGVVG